MPPAPVVEYLKATMHLSVVDSIERVASTDWDRLASQTNPFLRHAFLAALERSGSASAQTGWLPCHLLVHADGPGRGPLVGAAPLYLKSHSYGEYVFDWAWAHAYERARLRYYPKLVAAVPFTPVSGPRLLPEGAAPAMKRCLIEGALALAEQTRASSLHWLFTPQRDIALFAAHGHLHRTGCQFHWHNRGYQGFGEFLARLSSAKRKKLKQERRYVRDAGVEVEVLCGQAIRASHWDHFHRFYLSTVRQHGAIAYLNQEFFRLLGETMAESVVLVLARQNGDYIAGALNLRGTDSLYGRYWGTRRALKALHFEICYYTAIEYCIEQGIARFEAGAQGEHKLARGFLPTATHSAHWLRHPEFARAIADYLHEEQSSVDYYMARLRTHSPFRQPD